MLRSGVRLVGLILCLSWLTAPADAAPPNYPGLGPAGTLQSIRIEPAGEAVLRGRNARRQLVVTGMYSSGQQHDLTVKSTFSSSSAATLTVDASGFVSPAADGDATVTASVEGKTAMIALQVQRCGEQLPINFANEIVPLFTKLGCNAGGCHGKADGQNGFRLSLLGFYPDEDYDFLVKEDRGRRIFPAEPEFSLLLQKPSNRLPHGGGLRMSPGSYEWQLVLNWIEQGMPYGTPEDPVLKRIEIVPPTRAMNRESKQQLGVVAHYSDGTTQDVTRLATFEPNDKEMAETTPGGVVSTLQIPGETAVMVRFQGEVAVFRANIPMGMPVENLPPTRNFIDELVFNKLKSLGIPPSPVCDDATFLRRVTVDIAGRLPTADEAKAFVADADPNKRDRLIDQLLESPGYGEYFANKWAAVLRNKRRNGNDVQYTFRFHQWIRSSLQQNMPYDQFVRNVICATGEVETHPPVAWYKEANTPTLQMEDTAQLFLGMRLACAKCHHHPFERWSQNDYYGFEAFFSQVGLKPGRYSQNNVNDRVYHRGNVPQATNPRTQKPVPPTGLGAAPLDIPPQDDARQYLMDWMTQPDNPFFAKALANRYWKHFLGRGIVDPEDDMRVTNPPSNPELLDALARSFVESKFDLKGLVRTICRSSVYQLSSEPNEYNLVDKRNFSSFYPRRLNAEPLYDAVHQVAGVTPNFGQVPGGTTAVQLPDNGFGNYFLSVFGKPEGDSACECERKPEANLAQSLHLLNSNEIQGILGNGAGRANQLAADDKRSDADKVTEIYYWAFARPPRAEELQTILSHIGAAQNKSEAYQDLLWAIFNTKEFLFVR
jgi:hypothetical protein